MTDERISGIILAGGTSRRMGTDKALLRLPDGSTLLARTVQILREVVDDVVVAGRDIFPPEIAPVTAVPDIGPTRGPLGGLVTGLCHARYQWAFVLAVDLPLLKADTLRALMVFRPEAEAVVPVVSGRPQPLLGLFNRSTVERARDRLGAGDYRLQTFIEEVRTRWVPGEELRAVDPDLRTFTNVNSPTEWEQIQHAYGT